MKEMDGPEGGHRVLNGIENVNRSTHPVPNNLSKPSVSFEVTLEGNSLSHDNRRQGLYGNCQISWRRKKKEELDISFITVINQGNKTRASVSSVAFFWCSMLENSNEEVVNHLSNAFKFAKKTPWFLLIEYYIEHFPTQGLSISVNSTSAVVTQAFIFQWHVCFIWFGSSNKPAWQRSHFCTYTFFFIILETA